MHYQDNNGAPMTANPGWSIKDVPRVWLEEFAIRALAETRRTREVERANGTFLAVLAGFLLGAALATGGFVIGAALG